MFNSKMYLPDLKLAPWIKVYWFLKGEGKGNEYKKRYILPDGCATIVFVLEGEMFLETYSKGVLKRGIYIIPPTLESHFDNISDNISLIDVQLNPGVFYELFNLPIEELEDKVYSFDDLSINFNSNLLEVILEKRDSRVKLIRELNRFFINLFNKNEFTPNYILKNISSLYESNSLEEFYESQDLSARQIQRKVKHITGLSPKMISRIARFNNILKDLKNSKSKLEFANIAFNYDYSDQSHFIRDFKSFTRNSPKVFLENSQNYLQYKAIK